MHRSSNIRKYCTISTFTQIVPYMATQIYRNVLSVCLQCHLLVTGLLGHNEAANRCHSKPINRSAIRIHKITFSVKHLHIFMLLAIKDNFSLFQKCPCIKLKGSHNILLKASNFRWLNKIGKLLYNQVSQTDLSSFINRLGTI